MTQCSTSTFVGQVWVPSYATLRLMVPVWLTRGGWRTRGGGSRSWGGTTGREVGVSRSSALLGERKSIHSTVEAPSSAQGSSGIWIPSLFLRPPLPGGLEEGPSPFSNTTSTVLDRPENKGFRTRPPVSSNECLSLYDDDPDYEIRTRTRTRNRASVR